jgi:hypothetical protein
MSCLGPYYNLPIPREWSRVQRRCPTYDPAIIAMLEKGNVLQYKKNSGQLTKAQRYSKVVTGTWTNRNTTWASQTQEYTYPNTKYLQRINSINVTTDGIPTNLPVTCPDLNPSPYSPGLPSNTQNGNGTPNIPPPPVNPPPVINGIPPGPNPVPPEPTVIQDGGELICGTLENPCTQQVIVPFTSGPLCYPSTCSNVPGPQVDLCWDPKLQTWYTKTGLNMNNSTDKWPTGSKAIFPYNGYNPFNF